MRVTQVRRRSPTRTASLRTGTIRLELRLQGQMDTQLSKRAPDKE